MSRDATPQDVLREAARILMRDGWRQHWTGDDNTSKCAYGAIKIASGVSIAKAPSPLTFATARLFDRWLVAHEGVKPSVHKWCHRLIGPWNDAPERTAEDVILALKRAAEES